MNVKILTFSKKNNFGANLQCYALCKVLDRYGTEVEIINFQIPKTNYGLIGNLFDSIKTFLNNRFRNKYLPPFTQNFSNELELKKYNWKGDLFIVGSDQVWNPEITKSISVSAFFFNFLPNNIKRISYAASFGVANWKDATNKDEISNYLKKFSAIGVRESSGVSICQKDFGVNATAVLDPTLLLDNYDEIIRVKSNKKTNELICFKFVRSQEFTEVCKYIGEKLNLKPTYLNENHPVKGLKYKPFVSVKKWLTSIYNSEFVITDSFHCMVFAIIFKKRFIALPGHSGRIERLVSLLTKLGLKERIYNDIKDIYIEDKWTEKIDYKTVHQYLEKEREQSLNFLSMAILKK